MSHAPDDLYSCGWNIAKLIRVVGFGKNSLRQVLAYLVLINVDSCDKIDIPDVISSQIDMHQTGHEFIVFGFFVIVDSLYEGRCAVAHAYNCYVNFSHFGQLLLDIRKPNLLYSCRCQSFR